MYTANRCSEPNQDTSPTPQEVARRTAHIADIDRRFVAGNQVMADLVNGLTPPIPGGTCADLTMSSALQALTPYSNAVIIAPDPATGKPVTVSQRVQVKRQVKVPGSSTAFRNGKSRNGGSGFLTWPWGGVQQEARVLIPPCPCAKFVPKVFPLPVKTMPVVIPSPTVQTRKNCRTDNICRDLRTGCVQQVQVSKAQLFACAKAGWSGNWGMYPLSSNPPYIGDVDLNPSQPGPGETMLNASKQAGLAGVVMDASQSPVFWGALVFAWFAYMYARDYSRKK
jgi:hypothetical protein